jgi:signal transduction histidine kinase
VSPLVIEGAVMGAVQSFRDVSERQAIDELKRQFVSIVSHELRTPLTSIKGSLQMLDSGLMGPLSDEQQELLTMAVNNSERLGQLVNDILDLERLDSGRMPLAPEPTSAAAIATRAAAGMTGAADAAGIRLVVIEPPTEDDVDVTADPHRLVQVLTNLIGNAIKFSERGSTIRLSVTRIDDEVRTAVTDRGRGIPESQIAKVFDRFGQVDPGDARREGGTGLGLAIAQEIVVRSGGRIEVASDLGKGSTFTVVLPALHPRAVGRSSADVAGNPVLLPASEERG